MAAFTAPGDFIEGDNAARIMARLTGELES
jgi:hypothetical protein